MILENINKKKVLIWTVGAVSVFGILYTTPSNPDPKILSVDSVISKIFSKKAVSFAHLQKLAYVLSLS